MLRMCFCSYLMVTAELSTYCSFDEGAEHCRRSVPVSASSLLYCPGLFSLCTFTICIASVLYCPPMVPRAWPQPGVDALLVTATRIRARCSKRRGDKALLCLDKSSVKTVQVKERGCVACVFVLISGTQRSLAHNVGSMKTRSTAPDPYQFLPQVFCIVLGCPPSVPSRFV